MFDGIRNLSAIETYNTHFKTDVKGKPCHGLNASYGDRRTGLLIVNKKILQQILTKIKCLGGFYEKNISFVIFTLISCVSTGKPSDSNYLLKSYGAPVDYEITKDEMTGL